MNSIPDRAAAAPVGLPFRRMCIQHPKIPHGEVISLCACTCFLASSKWFRLCEEARSLVNGHSWKECLFMRLNTSPYRFRRINVHLVRECTQNFVMKSWTLWLLSGSYRMRCDFVPGKGTNILCVQQRVHIWVCHSWRMYKKAFMQITSTRTWQQRRGQRKSSHPP